MSKELNKASVEQAGGDERAAVRRLSEEAESTVIGMVEYCLNARVCLGMDEGFKSFDPEEEHDFVKELREFVAARAALAQPSTKCANCGDTGQIVVSGPHYCGQFQPPEYETEPCDMCSQPSPAQADEKPGDSILCYGCFAKGVGPEHFDEAGKCLVRQQLDPLNLAQHAEEFNEAPAEALKPEQAKAERLDWSSALLDVAVLQEALTSRDSDERMKNMDAGDVIRRAFGKLKEIRAQHDRIVGELRAVIAQLRQHKNDYMDSGQETYRALQNEIREREAEIARLDGLVSGRTAERDAAQARVAELERQEPVAAVSAETFSSDGTSDIITRNLPIGTKLYANPVAQAGQVPQAWLDVQAERRRQIEAEGWTPENDDAHSHGQMARAAACYALAGSSAPNDGTAALLVSLAWPWDEQWWKPSTARRDLVKACALGLAEIERLDRAAAPGKEGV
ncbi:hypothetical protein QOU43_07710 [Pseudomonas aeruginosa]